MKIFKIFIKIVRIGECKYASSYFYALVKYIKNKVIKTKYIYIKTEERKIDYE